MSKNFLKLVIAFGILLGIILIVWSITNHPKTPATAEQVWNILEAQGFEPVDTTQSYIEEWGENSSMLQQAIGTETEDIHFEFFVFDNDKSAEYVRGVYQTWIRDNRYYIPNVEMKEGMANYMIYTLEANGMYSVNIRVGNTLIFAYSDENNAEKIDNIVLAMDYFR